jgi:ribosome maturation factor RimP
LLRAAHFLRFHDLDAKVRVGNDQFTGKIRAVEDDVVTFEVAGDKRNIAISQIDTARLAEWPEEPR